MDSGDGQQLIGRIARRYGNVDAEALESVLCPILVPVLHIEKQVTTLGSRARSRPTFTLQIDDANRQLMQAGRTGKFVPKSYVEGGTWREIAKGRILEVDSELGIARGEIYVGGSKSELAQALDELSDEDYLEIDQYGAAAKVLSGLVEYTLARRLIQQGYGVRRMPEDVARHVRGYYYYDFEVERDGVKKRLEVKSLWGTNTRYARLIHSKTKGYDTSSCKCDTQDLFAVSLFLRTGKIDSFAFARSVPNTIKPYGLPPAPDHPQYVHQNPPCEIGDGTWFASLGEVWNLE